uniref:Piwi domain-containing protein n=1 Tax=Ditylenchus dipsaci TaxID=166011 RepID=A0A915CPE0_9BILA
MHERRMAQSVNIDLQSFDPSVVGITANMAAHPHNFLAERVKWVLEMLEKNRPQAAAPPFIFVLRNGLSEGQFAASVEKEMRALRKGVLCIVKVITEVRLCHWYQAPLQEVLCAALPGVLHDVSLSSQGVGKAVEYNVLVDDIKVSQDEVQGLLNSLCYSHQIVNSAASLPEPIYQADELAKRGRNNYITMKRLEEQFIPRKGECRLVDAGELTAMIGYKVLPDGKAFLRKSKKHFSADDRD